MSQDKNRRTSIRYSQNFTVNDSVVAKIISLSSLDSNDIVIEIGPGTGSITNELLRVVKKVIGIEIDKNLFEKLKEKYSRTDNIVIINGDFLSYSLPNNKYKVFSNIPFNITASIIKKLTVARNSPEDTYLFVQKESAIKFGGIGKETLASLLLKPFFNSSIVYDFNKTDFRPVPSVDIVLMRIEKRDSSLVEDREIKLYRDFIAYSFGQWKPTLREGLKSIFTDTQFARLSKDLKFSINAKPTELNFDMWLGLFNFFKQGVDINKRKIVFGSESRLWEQQSKLSKIHRTRTDNDWRNK